MPKKEPELLATLRLFITERLSNEQIEEVGNIWDRTIKDLKVVGVSCEIVSPPVEDK